MQLTSGLRGELFDLMLLCAMSHLWFLGMSSWKWACQPGNKNFLYLTGSKPVLQFFPILQHMAAEKVIS